MIFWSGWGILLPIFVAGPFLLGLESGSLLIAVWWGAAGAWLFALTIGKTKVEEYLDLETRRRVQMKRTHSLYFLPPKFWAVLVTGLAVLGNVCGFMGKFSPDENLPKTAFGLADDLIDRSENGVAHGNSPAARQAAAEFSNQCATLRSSMITKGKTSSLSMTDGKFLTYVNATPTQCAILVHVPQLRKFSAEAKAAMAEIAWIAGQTVSRNLQPQPTSLVVGIRGAVLYDRALIGSVTAPKPDRVVEGSKVKSELTRLFEPQPAAAPPLPTAMRDWRATDGRPLRAVMLRFVDPEKTTGEFQREDGQIFQVPMDRFDEEDRKFIESLRK